MSRQTEIEELIRRHQHRLQKLREQKATFGISTSPEVLTEIDDIEAEIKKLQTKLIGPKGSIHRIVIIVAIIVAVIGLLIGVSISIYLGNLNPPPAETEELTVFGNNNDGRLWCAPSTGTYLIRYVKGAYNGWKNDDECTGCWKTSVFIYEDREIEWEGSGVDLGEPVNDDFRLGLNVFRPEEEAQRLAQLREGLTRKLQKGSCLRFIAVDGHNNYFDNRGSVTVSISR